VEPELVESKETVLDIQDGFVDVNEIFKHIDAALGVENEQMG
jgi:hypothetical protein